MRYLLRNSILVLILLVFFVWQTIPPEQKLRLGKDLRGGTTLIYSVQMAPSDDPGEVMDKVIQVLKERVDPTGVLEIQMVAQGRDRLEITMPLPGPKVVELRKLLDETLAVFAAYEIDAGTFERIMRMGDTPDRLAEIQRVSAGIETKLELMLEAAEAYDEAERNRAALTLAETTGNVEDDMLDDLARQVALGERVYEEARAAVLAMSITPEEVRRALEQSTTQRRILDEIEEEMVDLPSPREQALSRLRAEHPELSDQLDAAIGAYDTYSANRTSLDDPSDLQRLLAGAGVLTFRITIDPEGAGSDNVHPDERELRERLRENGPRNAGTRDARWFKVNDPYNVLNLQSKQLADAFFADPTGVGRQRGFVLEEYQGEYWMLAWDARGMRLTPAEGQWALARAYRGQDQIGRPAINFEMDARGARLLGELTGANIQNQMAVLLDDQVYTAPNLRGRISSNGQIEGEFSAAELDYVIRVMTAGSLQAKLSPEPLSINTIAPELGLDNLEAGMWAGIAALIIVSVFMLMYYFSYGLVAVLSLLCNAALILGTMSLARAAFTLPGIAGVILTFGMAVDANVLIYERVREELRKGQELRVAVRLGYQKALSSIVDGNVTNLIVCFVLAYTGTQEVKGFATTLGIGVASTLFSALVISRILISVLVDVVKVPPKGMKMLPMAIPFLERALEPRVNWMSFRYVAVAISAVFITIGVAMVATRGEKMLDTEFRGGTQVTLQFKNDDATPDPDDKLTMTRAEVEERVQAIGEGVDALSPLLPLRTAEIIPVDPADDGVTSDRFAIKTYATEATLVKDELVQAFADVLDQKPPLTFEGLEYARQPDFAPVYPVLSGSLDEALPAGGDYQNDVSRYIGGLVVMLRDIEPAVSEASLLERIELLRGKQDFSDTLGRQRELIVLEGTPERVEAAALVVMDEGLTFFDNEQAWRADVADREWELVVESLSKTTALASEQTFSSVIADTFKAQAVVAVALSFLLILIYIWVRFGSVRYSMAAILCLCHDVTIAIGLIAMAEILYDAHMFEGLTQALLIEPFKIDLNLVAAFLTIVGYSLNDTIVIMDRIRENRGKLPYASRDVINDSINQTISRTVITSGTTFLAVLILYVFGGPGVRAFSYALLIGVVVGTYSSIAVAAPLVWSRKADRTKDRHLTSPDGSPEPTPA